MITPSSPEDERQLELLNTPLGLPSSGLVRYAAAMYFFQRGQVSEHALEIYRSCGKEDWRDPTAE
jgi:hypothetical protein